MTATTDLQSAIDSRLSEALATANYRITLNNQKQNARLKLQKDLTFSINGGTFNVTPELVSFISALMQHGQEEAILLDVNKNPIEIENLEDFFDTIIEKYYQGMNDFLVEFKAMQKTRTVKALVGEQ